MYLIQEIYDQHTGNIYTHKNVYDTINIYNIIPAPMVYEKMKIFLFILHM